MALLILIIQIILFLLLAADFSCFPAIIHFYTWLIKPCFKPSADCVVNL